MTLNSFSLICLTTKTCHSIVNRKVLVWNVYFKEPFLCISTVFFSYDPVGSELKICTKTVRMYKILALALSLAFLMFKTVTLKFRIFTTRIKEQL